MKQRCSETIERGAPGLRYVFSRRQCKNTTDHPSGYCKVHRFDYRWTPAQEAAYQAAQEAAK